MVIDGVFTGICMEGICPVGKCTKDFCGVGICTEGSCTEDFVFSMAGAMVTVSRGSRSTRGSR